jgi:hypothetical protein
MAVAGLANDMEIAIRAYIDACNAADAEAISRCFCADAVHYFPGIPQWSGSTTIGANFAKRVAETGQWWTVDQVLTDVDRRSAVLEWTRFDPSRRQILRGVDWFVFETGTLHIQEVRPYMAARPDTDSPRQELQGLDYAARGYPVNFPD